MWVPCRAIKSYDTARVTACISAKKGPFSHHGVTGPLPIFEGLQGRCFLGSHQLEGCGMGYINPGTPVVPASRCTSLMVAEEKGVGTDRD
jgi:hypothetical protein